MKHYTITTPIYYVNDSPHIGHAYTTIACDVMARYQQLSGNHVTFVTGTDEHGQKVDKAALAASMDPQSFTDDVSERFKHLVLDPETEKGGTNLLNSTNTHFIRTTSTAHKHTAQAFWKRLENAGYIYKDRYSGWYAVRDEAYYQEAELIEKEGQKCAPSGAPVEWVEEESYFFRLSDFGEKLLAFFETHPDFVQPKSRYNEVKAFVEGGLKDLSISRTTFSWGVPVPDDPSHVMYVWIDALTNYLTACDFSVDPSQFNQRWGEGKQGHAIHVVGKDILRFHAVYWPAFLMAANLPLPKHIIAHGWWTIEGQKMSKSLGNALSPTDMMEAAGSIDGLRYYMLRAMPFGNDGDFSNTRLHEVMNADLANNIGNLVQRTLSMLHKHGEATVPPYPLGTPNKEDLPLLEQAPNQAIALYHEGFSHFAFHKSIEAILQLSSQANTYIDQQAPWLLRKQNPARMLEVLYILANTLRILGLMLQPFTPEAAAKLLDQLAIPEAERHFDSLDTKHHLASGTALPSPSPIFPRLEKKE